MPEGYNGLPPFYVESSDPITPNLGLSLAGADPLVAENFYLIDTAFAGISATVDVNGVAVPAPANFINSTSVTFSVSGHNISLTATGGSGAPGGTSGQVQFNNAGVFGGIPGSMVNGPFGQVTIAPTGTAVALALIGDSAGSDILDLYTNAENNVLSVDSSGDLLVYGDLIMSGNGTIATSGAIQDYNGSSGIAGQVLSSTGSQILWVSAGTGTVTSVSFTGGLISVATPTTTPALTVAGTSGGVPYFSSASTWASSAALPAGDFVLGGGAGAAPTASFSVVPVANGGTGTGSTLTGLIRGSGTAFTAAEISGDATTSGSNALTLATVNSNVGSFTNASITVNAKGLITAASSGSAGSGTVTSFSAGNLSPLFTTSVATATTTPALSFSLSNAAGGTVFGNPTGSSGAPSYTAVPVLGVNASVAGTLGLATSVASGATITLTNPGALSAYNFELPITVGAAGSVLTSQAGSAMTWTTQASLAVNWSAILAGSNTQTGAFSTAAPWTYSYAGTASTAAISITGAPYTGGSGTTTFPLVYINSGAAPTTFSTAGTELGINAPSGFTGNFEAFYVNGGSSVYSVGYTGSVTMAGAFTNTISPSASQSAITVSGAPYAGGTATTNFPLFYINGGAAPTTLSASGTEFGINAPSGFAGTLVDLRINGAGSVFTVSSSGATISTAGITAGSSSKFTWTSRSNLQSPADSQIVLANNAGTAFAALMFGGTTSSFVSLQSSGTTLTVGTGASGTGGSLVVTGGLTVGVAGTLSGVITLEGSTSGAATIAAPAVSGTVTNPIAISNSINLSGSGAVYQAQGTSGVSAGSFSAITAITTVGGIVTQLTGSSDARLKDSVPYEGGLNEILAITPARYRWNKKGQAHTGLSGDKAYVGFIAQDVQKAIPEAITATELSKDGTEEYLSFDDRPVVAALVNAVKELAAKVRELESKCQSH